MRDDREFTAYRRLETALTDTILSLGSIIDDMIDLESDPQVFMRRTKAIREQQIRYEAWRDDLRLLGRKLGFGEEVYPSLDDAS